MSEKHTTQDAESNKQETASDALELKDLEPAAADDVKAGTVQKVLDLRSS